VVDRLVRDQSVPIERVEKAMALIERQKATEAKAAWTIAMAQAQQEMTAISRDSSNPQTKSRYASLAALDGAIRPIYSKHGLAPTFDTKPSLMGETWIKIICEVSHVGGHAKEYTLDMPADGKGAKGGDVMTRTHATMSAVTYGRRGLLKMVFNLAETDDDGVAAGNGPQSSDEFFVTSEQIAELEDLIEKTGRSIKLFCLKFRLDDISQLPASKHKEAVAFLNTHIPKAQP
jgi:hypothetical protein